ncbi:hypothetical protein BCF74_13421 [Knoellia remsis]|uniref:Uncharacterized protein n=1 Tax=Knoellia remsis TaxID=407159 RepID=A0A2T0U2U2_9MICO|nr:hypothetical protein [Knoellia remsis]PRY52242.1 hypothetical protein BCF74_13421 [Knoellia remsis]
MTNRVSHEQIMWIHEYNAYDRLARTPEKLYELIRPAHEHFEHTGRVPDWCGTDFLRGWAFYLARADRHAGAEGSHHEISAILEVLDSQDANE